MQLGDPKIRVIVRDFFNMKKGRASYKAISKRIMGAARIDGIHMCQLMAAMLIASIGLNVDSTEAVIGAMLICPLMGSVVAIACAIATVDTKWLRQSLAGLGVQVLVCLLTSTVYFLISPLSRATSELLTNSSATVWDVFIALAGGFAGALGSSRRETPSTLVAGVAVATALMPPLCSTGFGIALRDWSFAAAAFYEFLINVVFITFGAELVFVALRMPLLSDLDGDGVVTEAEKALAEERSAVMRRRLVIGSLVFAIPCFFFSARVVSDAMSENGTIFAVQDTYDVEFTTYELKAVCPELVGYRIGAEDSYDVEGGTIVRRVVATVETSAELDEKVKAQLEELIRLNVEDLDHVTFEVVDGES